MNSPPDGDAVEPGTIRESFDHLVVINPPGPHLNRPLPLLGEICVVGRDPGCDVHLEADDVSRRHARFVRSANEWRVEDLQSTNGTFVGGEPTSVARLEYGDDVQLGKHTLRLLQAGSRELRRHDSLFRELRVDQATGLPFRELFEDVATPLLRDGERPAALFVVDVEYLDAVNKRLGRAYGDRLLRHIAREVVSGVEVRSCAGRLHGKRFAVLLAGVDEARAAELARAMQTLVARLQEESSHDVRVELSVGGIVLPGGRDASIGDLISMAEPLTQSMSRLGGGVRIEAATDLPGEQTKAIRIDDVGGGTVITGRAAFERDLERRFQQLVAFSVDQRQQLEARDPALVLKLDRLLQSSLDEAYRESLETTGAGDTGITSASIRAGKLPGGIFVVALTAADHRRARSLATLVERSFERHRQQAGLPTAHVTSGSPVQVEANCIDRAVDALVTRLRTADTGRRLPLPIGLALAQVASEQEPMARFFALTRVHQAITRWIFTVLGADCLLNGVSLPARIREGLAKNMTEGMWVDVARHTAQAARSIRPSDRGAPSLLEAVFPRGGKSPVLDLLAEFTPARNSIAHGGYRQADGLAKDWDMRFRQLLMGPLRVLELIVPRHVSQLRRRGGAFEITLRELVGDHAVVPTSKETVAEPLESQKVFALDPAARSPLSLDPLVVYANCRRCDLDELFFLEGVQGGYHHASIRSHKLASLSDADKDARDVMEAEAALDRLLTPQGA